MVAYALRAAKFCLDIVERHQHDRSSATERDFDFILNLHDRSDEIFRCEIRFEIGGPVWSTAETNSGSHPAHSHRN